MNGAGDGQHGSTQPAHCTALHGWMRKAAAMAFIGLQTLKKLFGILLTSPSCLFRFQTLTLLLCGQVWTSNATSSGDNLFRCNFKWFFQWRKRCSSSSSGFLWVIIFQSKTVSGFPSVGIWTWAAMWGPSSPPCVMHQVQVRCCVPCPPLIYRWAVFLYS